MSKKEIWKLFIGSILFSLLSCSLVIYFHIGITHEITWDLLGVFSGVLSILVTALIGWQVYSVIFWKKEMDNRINKIINEKIDRVMLRTNLLMYESYQTNLQGYINAKEWTKVIIMQKAMINILKELKNTNLTNKYVKHINDLLSFTEEMSCREIRELKELIEDLKGIFKYSDKAIDLYILAKDKLNL